MRLVTMLLAGGWFLSSIVTAQAASPSLATSSGGYATQQNPTSSLNVFSGTVYDENGDPMPLVTVQILGQTGGFITDSKGHFEFKTKNATERVRVTFMGYKAKAVTLRGGTPLRIDLEPDNQTIESVVVTGFTKKDKKSYTGRRRPSSQSSSSRWVRRISCRVLRPSSQVCRSSSRITSARTPTHALS